MMRPETRYARNGDVSIAYQVFGKGPFDLVLLSPWGSHVELAWETPSFRALFERLGAFARVINFDKRGSGLSDRSGGLASPETRMDDIRAVMDAVSSERAAIFGWSEGVRLSLLFAATYPDRAWAVIACGGRAERKEAPGEMENALRALAVLSVIGFHFEAPCVFGGFVGVDADRLFRSRSSGKTVAAHLVARG